MRRVGAVALVLAGLAPSAGWGQGWVVDVSAGGIDHETVAANVGTTSAMLGLRYDGPRWLYISLGAPLDSTGFPWGAGGLGGRLQTERRAFSVGADVGVHGHGYRETASGVTGAGAVLEVLPFVGASSGPAWLELHSGVRAYSAAYQDSTFSRGVIDSGARAGFGAGSLELSGEATLVRSADGSFPYLGADGQLAVPRGIAWATVGRWLADEIPTMPWGVGAKISVAHRIGVELSVQQESRDPLYWNLPRRLWTLGVSRSFGSVSTDAEEALPSPVPTASMASTASAGRVTIRVAAAEAGSQPAVAGDFTEWRAVPMVRSGDAWTAEFPLAAGVYRYAFQKADGSWFVPESLPDRVDDGFGGVSAVLVVR